MAFFASQKVTMFDASFSTPLEKSTSSNIVKTSGSSVSFNIEIQTRSFGDINSSPVRYSSGILQLKEPEIVYVFVGGELRPSNSSEGSTTSGGFPNGG